MDKTYKSVKHCRICNSTNLEEFLSLGKQPLPNRLLSIKDLEQPEQLYPLTCLLCLDCSLVQLGQVVSPEEMFSNYTYIPSTSTTLVNHFNSLAKSVCTNYGVDTDDLVIDIGSNDGTLLRAFKDSIGCKILGVEPASNIAQMAVNNGIPTLNEYFNVVTANKIVRDYGQAQYIFGTNVFAHVDNLTSFMNGVKLLLAPSGYFIIEVPYVKELINHTEFDTIYHEHLSYFSVHALSKLFYKYDMYIVDITEMQVHGGSIRVVVQNGNRSCSDNANAMLQQEEEDGFDNIKVYKDFANRVLKTKYEIKPLLSQISKDGLLVGGYGAAAKATVLSNYCELNSELISFIVDKNPMKQKMYVPGSRIPIISPQELAKRKTPYLFIFIWTLANEVMQEQSEYKDQGGKFIIPLPEVRIV